MVLSQILRFALPQASSAVSAPAFLKLRDFVKSRWRVEEQYFGYVIPVPDALQLEKSDEMCWVIQWPSDADLGTNPSFKSKLDEVTQGKDARSLLLEFNDSEMAELRKGLEAPVTQFAIISLSGSAPLENADLKHSMHKTYTDCYLTAGFSGGNWAYAVNTNDVDELLRSDLDETLIPEDERRLAVYPLGWESVKHHHAYSRTPLFDEEINKLAPWFGKGTGAWYVVLEKHGDQ